MDIIQITQELMKMKTDTGNVKEINECLLYIKNLFSGTRANIEIFDEEKTAPVIFISNTKQQDLDVLILGHIDVVPAPENMYQPFIDENGILHGRGSLDMKSFAVVGLNSMKYVLDNNLDKLKFGIILSSDEEKGSKGTKAFLKSHPELKSKIVLDNDVGGDIGIIINKCKNPVFVKLISEGLAAHGSTPWEGIDANENLMNTVHNLRKIYPYFSKNGVVPKDKWIDTLHFAKISGGEVANVISDYAEALLDFRLTENSSIENLENNLKESMEEGVTYKIVSTSVPVVMSEKDPDILAYKKLAEEILGREIKFEQIGGATDAREFAVRGSTVIMHSGTGDGMHTNTEYAYVDSILKISQIQIAFINRLAKEK